ncbi:MAG: cobalamin biosynthesis protein CbiG, partial [Proteobacteria bacterium]|nr:cobalamin biosynthesis protein CbiG [Pseudomonadota bacterium]
EAQLRTVLADLRRRGDRALIGFDFALGYPEGTAAKLKLADPAWASMWKFLADNVRDKADNTNNRFAVANKMNRLMTDEARPFWGAPGADVQTWLKSTKPVHGEDLPPLFRRTELAVQKLAGKTAAKSVWQIFGNGTVGSQAIVGIPAARRLLDELGPKGAVWPFTTGWRTPSAEELQPLEALLVEIYPRLYAEGGQPGEVVDQAQVREACEYFARLDEAGRLGALFVPPKAYDEAAVAAVEQEEGWILGAEV